MLTEASQDAMLSAEVPADAIAMQTDVKPAAVDQSRIDQPREGQDQHQVG